MACSHLVSSLPARCWHNGGQCSRFGAVAWFGAPFKFSQRSWFSHMAAQGVAGSANSIEQVFSEFSCICTIPFCPHGLLECAERLNNLCTFSKSQCKESSCCFWIPCHSLYLASLVHAFGKQHSSRESLTFFLCTSSWMLLHLRCEHRRCTCTYMYQVDNSWLRLPEAPAETLWLHCN